MTGVISSKKRERDRSSHSSALDALNCDDILCDILQRLPPESVVKLIIVSKRWLSCICSYAFRRSYLKRWKVSSNLLGFFVCNSLYLGRPQGGLRRAPSEPALPLLSTSKEGDDLKYSGVLKQLGYFVDSSNGLLLCGRHPKTYYVWDPITKQQHKLPRPRVYFEELCMAFIVEDSPDDSICYKVVRAKCECKHDKVNTVTIETFLSKTHTWYYLTLTCNSTLSLCPWKVATVIRGVIHWFAARGNIAIYNQECEERHINLIELPGFHDFDERVLGESADGLLQYGQSCKLGMEIWVLDKDQETCSSTSKWILRYKLNFKTMWKRNPRMMTAFSTCSKSKETQILSLQPQNSECVFLRNGENIFLCHLENREVEVVHYNGRGSSVLWDFSRVVPYFKPAWPQSSLCLW
ncbi:F-box protein [Melia azedarach]|uniref:F-box protein n=1 Tax=Melia azedarach TaxID=155640 RepID=A0ACC1Y961_MELAZ|nr:F-box protein [Melia azedarach]